MKQAGEDTIVITLADKIHNLRTLFLDWQQNGEEVWKKFNRGREKQKWYHESVYEATGNREKSEKVENLRIQYKQLIIDVFK